MTVFSSLSNAHTPPIGDIPIPDEIRRFISNNADELIRVANAAGRNAGAAATDLVDAVLSGTAPADLVSEMLIFVRDALRDSSPSTSVTSGHGRADLDAAIRWHGARLDELLRLQS